MGTFKENLYEICKEVASEFPGWGFAAGQFKSKCLKHTDILILLGLAFENGSTPLQPSVHLENKKTIKLYKSLVGWSVSTSFMTFQDLANELTHIPEKFRVSARIDQNKEGYLAYLASTNRTHLADRVVDITEVKPILQAVMRDGIALIERHYDLTSEENFLKALPPKYTPRNQVPYREFEQQKGVMMCVVRLILGDFDFVERYRSDEHQTAYLKRTLELDKIIAALPDLKRSYAETGSVI